MSRIPRETGKDAADGAPGRSEAEGVSPAAEDPSGGAFTQGEYPGRGALSVMEGRFGEAADAVEDRAEGDRGVVGNLIGGVSAAVGGAAGAVRRGGSAGAAAVGNRAGGAAASVKDGLKDGLKGVPVAVGGAAGAAKDRAAAGGSAVKGRIGGVSAAARTRLEELGNEALRRQVSDLVMLLPNLAKLLGRLAVDSRVPLRSRVFAAAALVYAVSPIDLVPGFIPVLGQADDILAVAMALDRIIGAAGPDVVREHWDGTERQLAMTLGFIGLVADLLPGPLRKKSNGSRRRRSGSQIGSSKG